MIIHPSIIYTTYPLGFVGWSQSQLWGTHPEQVASESQGRETNNHHYHIRTYSQVPVSS